MASEKTTSNVMLTGQTAYVKKEGSMVNHGVIHIEDTNASYEYDEGYVAEGSKIDGHKLEDTTEYQTCEQYMEVYLGDRYDSETEGYTIVNNCNMIKNALLPGETYVQTLLNSTNNYSKKSRFVSNDGCDFQDEDLHSLEITLPVNFKLVLDVNISEAKNAFNLFTNENNTFVLSKTVDNKLMLNDNEITTSLNTRQLVSIINKDGILSVQINNIDNLVNLKGIIEEGTVLTLLKDFIGTIYSVKLYDLDVSETDYLDYLYPMYATATGETGLYSVLNKKLYADKNNNLQYTKVEYVRGTIDVGIDTELLPNGLDLGIEIKYRMYKTVVFYSRNSYLFSNGVESVSYGMRLASQTNYSSITHVYYFHNDEITSDSSVTYANSVPHLIKYNINKQLTIDENVIQDKLVAKFADDVTIKLCKGNTDDYYNFYGYLYYAKIYNNDTGELLRDFIPVKDIDNVGCLYDNITKKLYYPELNEFITGSEVN